MKRKITFALAILAPFFVLLAMGLLTYISDRDVLNPYAFSISEVMLRVLYQGGITIWAYGLLLIVVVLIPLHILIFPAYLLIKKLFPQYSQIVKLFWKYIILWVMGVVIVVGGGTFLWETGSRLLCTQAGGDFSEFYGYPASPFNYSYCTGIPTKDAGKACTDGKQCEGGYCYISSEEVGRHEANTPFMGVCGAYKKSASDCRSLLLKDGEVSNTGCIFL